MPAAGEPSVGDLFQTIGEARVAFESARVEVQDRIAQSEARARGYRGMAIGGGILGIVGVLVALVAVSNAHNANTAVHRANVALAATTSNQPGSIRWAACQQYNKQQQAGIVAEQAEFDAVLAVLIPDPVRRAEVQRSINGHIVQERKLRDCSPAGITAYLARPAPTTSTTGRGPPGTSAAPESTAPSSSPSPTSGAPSPAVTRPHVPPSVPPSHGTTPVITLPQITLPRVTVP